MGMDYVNKIKHRNSNDPAALHFNTQVLKAIQIALVKNTVNINKFPLRYMDIMVVDTQYEWTRTDGLKSRNLVFKPHNKIIINNDDEDQTKFISYDMGRLLVIDLEQFVIFTTVIHKRLLK